MVSLRWISSSSKSVMVLPSSTRVSRLVAPAVKRTRRPASSSRMPVTNQRHVSDVCSFVYFHLILLHVGCQKRMLTQINQTDIRTATHAEERRWRITRQAPNGSWRKHRNENVTRVVIAVDGLAI